MPSLDENDPLDHADCDNCPWQRYYNPVRGHGPDRPVKLAFVAEGPGANEVRQGEPLVGKSGRLWQSTLQALGIDPEGVYKDSVVACRAPGNETPSDAVMRSCLPRLKKSLELRLEDGATIVTMGNVALAGLTGRRLKEVKITKERGKLVHGNNYQILPTIHPAAIDRPGGQVYFKSFRQDLGRAKDLAEGKDSAPPPVKYWVPKDVDEAASYIGWLLNYDQGTKKFRYFSLDIEADGLDKHIDDLLEVGIAPSTTECVVFPAELVQHPFLKPLFQQLFDSNIKWVFQNGKFDASFLYQYGYKIEVAHDTLLLKYCLEEEAPNYDLKTMASEFLGAEEYDPKDKYLKKKTDPFSTIPAEVRRPYCAKDCCYTLAIFKKLWPRVKADKDLKRAYLETVIPASKFLQVLEHNGIAIDIHYLNESVQAHWGKRKEVDGELKEMVGQPDFNPRSPKQVKEVYQEKYGIQVDGTTIDRLERMSRTLDGEAAIFSRIMVESRKINTRITRGLKGIVNRLHKGRVHSTYLLHGTVTGRLSSRNPNLQNIEHGEMRNLFTAMLGYLLGEIDYSQAELRILAAVSGDEALSQIYRDGLDLHEDVRRDIIAPIKSAWLHDRQRMIAKVVNFGVVYGVAPSSLCERFELTILQAKRIIQGWNRRFPTAFAFLREQEDRAMRGLPIISPFGRKRRFGLVNRDNMGHVKNEAKNFIPQSTASDLTLHSAMRLIKILPWLRAVNSVHDSNSFEIPEDPGRCQEVVVVGIRTYQDFATEVLGGALPFKADIKIGKHWGETNKIPSVEEVEKLSPAEFKEQYMQFSKPEVKVDLGVQGRSAVGGGVGSGHRRHSQERADDL